MKGLIVVNKPSGISSSKVVVKIKKMLNVKKGPGVRSLRAQGCKVNYPHQMFKTLSETDNLELKEAIVKELIVDNNVVKGIITEDNIRI